jgi:hypothetical protein
MDSTLTAAYLANDRSMVVFAIFCQGRLVQCGVSREALVQCFWAPADASERRLLQAYEDGRQRITAVAERKIRALAREPVILTVADFVRG